ncbi:MAG: Crp/Fnr family transcriptional regulator [Thermodesulfobacteriota bacterium]|nr:Crp/Fnr family transcriptional regulator [Thermodesulfobacteriota bacterium]
MKLIDQIARIPLFQGLAPKQMEDLAMILVDQVFKRGQSIFSEEDEGAGLYIIISGRVKIFKLSPDGKEQTLHIFGPGEPFGEVAVFTGRRFPANAEALEETRAFFFPRTEFVNLIRKDPSLALNMLAELSIRLRKFTILVENLALKEVPGRLAAYILVLSERKKGSAGLIELDISKNQLASLLGTIPETLSRILARMEREKLIKSEGKRITILDRRGLEELSSGERKLP